MTAEAAVATDAADAVGTDCHTHGDGGTHHAHADQAAPGRAHMTAVSSKGHMADSGPPAARAG
jgi:hypothetical protein